MPATGPSASEPKSIPTVCYWPMRGRAGACHLALAYTGTEYEHKTATKEEWAVDKPAFIARGGAFTFANLPYYHHGDVFVPQSSAIITYVLRKANPDFMGKDEADQRMVDILRAQVEDLRMAFYTLVFAIPPAAAKAAFAGFVEEGGALGKFLGGFESFLKEGKQFAGTDYTTVVDITAFDILNSIAVAFPKKFASYPKLAAWFHRFSAEPAVAGYLESQKDVPFVAEGYNWGGSATPANLEEGGEGGATE